MVKGKKMLVTVVSLIMVASMFIVSGIACNNNSKNPDSDAPTLNHDGLGDPNVEECMTILTPDNNQPSYTVVTIEGDKLTMTIKQVNGYVLDSFSIVA